MPLFWVFASVLFVVIGLVTLFDIIRNRDWGWSTAGWIALVVLLPFLGSLAYWISRRTTPEEIEGRYQAEAEFRRTGGGRTTDDLTTQRERDHF
jgi:hypothetical protein